MTEKRKRLTIKQKKFTKEYLETGNATEAARKAYNVDTKTASVMGSQNLRKLSIQEEINEAQAKLGLSAEYVLKGIKEIADFNKKTFSRKVKKVIGEGSDAKIEEIEEIKMIDANASLRAHEMLGKNLALFTEKMEITGKDGKDLIPEEKRKDLARKLAFLFNAAKTQD